MRTTLLLGLAFTCLPATVLAQTVVTAGDASYASTPPAYKSRTDLHDGYQAGLMLTRHIYCDERDGRPIPTNDWWTDIINNRYSGALWSYPAMLRTGDYGVQVHRPSYWADEGKEIKSRSFLTVSALSFTPEAAIAADWHDLDVTFRMPDRLDARSQMHVTMAHGIPFTWFEYDGLTPSVAPSDAATLFGVDTAEGMCGMRIGNDIYGLYFPEGCVPTETRGVFSFPGASWLVVAQLNSEADLSRLNPYATGVVRDSEVSWHYNPSVSTISTHWHIDTEDLRDPGHSAPVLMGLLPHVYKYSPSLPRSFDGLEYTTPRGTMKMYEDAVGDFGFTYSFSGMLPYYAAPAEDRESADGFRSEVMETLMRTYAEKGTFGADTYWGGKGLVQMALNMTFAKECGDESLYQASRSALRDAFTDWLTYTPGEDSGFFSYYPRWGAMLGFNVSYDSDAFNDHHFHYGYFTYAAALLCMEDPEFAAGYGELLRLIAKDYANYDRTDTRFPFMRTLDPWCDHSWAGGLGDAGNDNGNGQESTSEAMQSWGGLYLLGVALGDDEMRDAGIWGWSTEARATREYWFDVDAPRPANAGGRQPWSGKNDCRGNYDYTQYKYAYNSNITGKGIGWWTWFGGDPLFMHGIQWMPVSPALDYLSWDTDFVGWAFDDMMSGANSSFSHEWFTETYNTDNGEAIQPLADNDWGNVALAYMQRNRPQEAAAIFGRALREGRHIATAVSTGHISYYLIHHHLTYGDIDFSVSADIPTASAYLKDGEYTYMVYNPYDSERAVKFVKDGATLRTVLAPGRRLTAFTAPAEAAAIEIDLEGGTVIPPGESASVMTRVLDQYGATASGAAPVTYTTSLGGAEVKEGRLTVPATVSKGTRFTLTATSGDLIESIDITVNDRPVPGDFRFEGLPEYIEQGATLTVALAATDQYGEVSHTEVSQWLLTGEDTQRTVSSTFKADRPGRYTLSAVPVGSDAEVHSEEIIVLPVLPDVARKATAVSSSEENAGCLTSNVNDGDRTTRWGSRHTDNEWIMLDLGEETYVSAVTLDWEAAYGADYDLQMAPDGSAMTDYKGDYAGQVRTVSVPAEDQWKTVAEVRGNTRAGRVETSVNAAGRYLRMKGITRGSVYGYSIHEMEARGIPLSMDDNAIVGIDFGLPEAVDQWEPIGLSPVAYTLTGGHSDVKVAWSADKASEFSGNDFTPLEYGTYTITAETEGGLRSTGSLFVNEGVRRSRLSLVPASTQTVTGEETAVEISAFNQFGGLYPLDLSLLDIRINDKATGKEVGPDVARFDRENCLFVSDVKGEYVIDINKGEATATINVLDITEANLALHRYATATTSEADWLSGPYAVDGDRSTRWGSQFMDEQALTVDLGRTYELKEVRIYWDEVAYATDYTVETSENGDDYLPLFSRRSWQGAPVGGDCRLDSYQVTTPAYGRFIRLTGHHRSTGYGTSIRELEVYGDRDTRPGTGIRLPGTDTPLSGPVYSLQGIMLRSDIGLLETRPLPPGIYIVGGRKVIL